MLLHVWKWKIKKKSVGFFFLIKQQHTLNKSKSKELSQEGDGYFTTKSIYMIHKYFQYLVWRQRTVRIKSFFSRIEGILFILESIVWTIGKADLALWV